MGMHGLSRLSAVTCSQHSLVHIAVEAMSFKSLKPACWALAIPSLYSVILRTVSVPLLKTIPTINPCKDPTASQSRF